MKNRKKERSSEKRKKVSSFYFRGNSREVGRRYIKKPTSNKEKKKQEKKRKERKKLRHLSRKRSRIVKRVVTRYEIYESVIRRLIGTMVDFIIVSYRTKGTIAPAI